MYNIILCLTVLICGHFIILYFFCNFLCSKLSCLVLSKRRCHGYGHCGNSHGTVRRVRPVHQLVDFYSSKTMFLRWDF